MKYLALLALLLAGLVSACGDIAPDKFTVDGVAYRLPAERNAPRDRALRPGVELVLYHATVAEIAELTGGSHAGGATMLIGDLCMVWLLDPKLVDQHAYDRLYAHEVYGHCNGWTHTLDRSATGDLVIDWQAPETTP